MRYVQQLVQNGKLIVKMKTEYTLAFLGGIELMAFANAFSLGLLPCQVLAGVFLLAALAAVGVTGFFLGRRSCRNAVNRRSAMQTDFSAAADAEEKSEAELKSAVKQ